MIAPQDYRQQSTHFRHHWPRQTSHALVQLEKKSNSLHFVIKRSKVSVAARPSAFLWRKHTDWQFYTFCCWSWLLLSSLLLNSYLSCSECPPAVLVWIWLHSETDHSEHRFDEVSRLTDNCVVCLLLRNTEVNVIENLSSVKTLWLWNLQLAQNVLRAWKSLKSHLLRRLECRLKKLWEKCDFVSIKTHVLQPVPVSSSLSSVNGWRTVHVLCPWSFIYKTVRHLHWMSILFVGALLDQSCCIWWNLLLVNKTSNLLWLYDY